jgi:hypothetical protein
MASLFEGFQTRASVMKFVDPVTKEDVTFALDVTKSIVTTLSAGVTQFPIEGRKNITDHIQPSPLSLSLECMISESPSQQLYTLVAALVSASIGQVVPAGLSATFAKSAGTVLATKASLGGSEQSGSIKSLLMNREEYDSEFPKKAMQGLISMFQAGAIFSLHTFFTKSLYTDMVMTSLSFNQTPKEGDSLAFSMSCTQVKTTTAFSEATNLELKAVDPVGSSASGVADKGKVTPKPATPPGSSLMYSPIKFFRGE